MAAATADDAAPAVGGSAVEIRSTVAAVVVVVDDQQTSSSAAACRNLRQRPTMTSAAAVDVVGVANVDDADGAGRTFRSCKPSSRTMRIQMMPTCMEKMSTASNRGDRTRRQAG